MFNSINEVYDWLYHEIEAKPRHDFSRIEEAAKCLDVIPDYKIIHIAGTNGKGSVAADIKSILSLTGRHVGFFVSPYVISFNERIEINDRYISDAEIMHYANILYPLCDDYKKSNPGDMIPFFEITLLMALMFFKDRRIDMAVIECGMGGLLDSTNFLKSDLAIITNVGWDHMKYLGNTLEEIASHKLGIIRPHMHAITAVDESLYPAFQEYAKEHDASITYITKDDVTDIHVSDGTYFTYKEETYKSSLLGRFQAYNAALAIEAVRCMDPSIPKMIIDFGLENVKWPGRMEILSKNPLIILDGGHNISAVNESVLALKEIKKDKKTKILFYSLMDKDYPSMLKKLDTIADKFYFTQMEDRRKADPSKFTSWITHPYAIIDDADSALMASIKELGSDEVLFITGSLHFISLIREKYFKKIKE